MVPLIRKHCGFSAVTEDFSFGRLALSRVVLAQAVPLETGQCNSWVSQAGPLGVLARPCHSAGVV